MYKTINGFTKESMKEVIRKEFKGQAVVPETRTCQYLTEDGKKCVVGCFIPNEYLQLDKVKNSQCRADSLIEDVSDLKKFMPLDKKGLLDMQNMHDEGLFKTDGDSYQMEALLNWIDENVE